MSPQGEWCIFQLTCPSDWIGIVPLMESAFFFLAARCFLIAALARAIVVRRKFSFVRAIVIACHKQPNLRDAWKVGSRANLLTNSKLDICENGSSPQLRKVFGLAQKVGWMSSVQPSWKSRRKTKIARSSPRLFREMRGVGVQQRRGARRFAWSSISRKGSSAYRLSLRKMKLPARRNSFCAGLRMAEAQRKKLCDSNGISVHLTRYARSRNIK